MGRALHAIIRLASRGQPRRASMAFALAAWESAEQRRWRDAIATARLALAADPSWPVPYRILAQAQLMVGEVQGARATLRSALAQGVESSLLDALLCETEIRLRDDVGALAAHRRLIENQFTTPAARWLRVMPLS